MVSPIIAKGAKIGCTTIKKAVKIDVLTTYAYSKPRSQLLSS